MGLSEEELDRLADEMYLQRRISSPTYCATFGYNLRTLPHVYTCPECGHAYNARPLKMRGIFLPYEYEPPMSDAAATILCAFGAFLLIARGVNPVDQGLLIIGSGFGVLAIVYAVKFVLGMLRYLRARSIARRIEMDEEE